MRGSVFQISRISPQSEAIYLLTSPKSVLIPYFALLRSEKVYFSKISKNFNKLSENILLILITVD